MRQRLSSGRIVFELRRQRDAYSAISNTILCI